MTKALTTDGVRNVSQILGGEGDTLNMTTQLMLQHASSGPCKSLEVCEIEEQIHICPFILLNDSLQTCIYLYI